MFVKLYKYHVQPDKVDEFLAIQDKAVELYSQHLDLSVLYLRSEHDPTKWLEIAAYKDRSTYDQGMAQVDGIPEIVALFQAFQQVLVPGQNDVIEEDFAQIRTVSKSSQ